MIQNLKDLEKLLKLLRKQGVITFKMGEIDLKLGDLPVNRPFQESETAPEVDTDPIDDPYANFPAGMLTDAQAAHYASGGFPENDPELVGRQ